MKKKVFKENVKMETQTVFHQSGSVDIYPCDFELGQQIVAGGERKVRQKGRMVTADDGRSCFRPYAVGSGSRYTDLWVVPYGVLKMSKTKLVLKVSVPLVEGAINKLEDAAIDCLPFNTDMNVLDRIYERIHELKSK